MRVGIDMSYSLDNSATNNYKRFENRNPIHVLNMISNGPFGGKLFRVLDMLGQRPGKSYAYNLVHSRSKATDGVHASMKNDMLVFRPPVSINPSDVFYSENSKVILDEEPYVTILELITECFHGGNIVIRDWSSVRKELMDGAEMWALFKHRVLDAHYNSELNNRQTLVAKVLDMGRAFENCILFERDRARDEGDDVVKLIFVKQAIEAGLFKANETMSAVAYKAHQTLKGTALAEIRSDIQQNKDLREHLETKINDDSDSDSATWFAQLCTCPSGNAYFPESTFDAKRIVAIGHLLEANWILVSSEDDTVDKEACNFLFVPPEMIGF